MTRIRQLRARRDDGASAVEYGLLVAAIAAIVVTVVFAIGNFVQDAFEDTCTNINTATDDADAATDHACDTHALTPRGNP